jgi:hypothetical protein
MKILPERFYTPGWNVDWMKIFGENTTALPTKRTKRRLKANQELKEDTFSTRNTLPDP